MSAADYTLEDIRAAKEILRKNKIRTYFPDHGPLRRELYSKHIAVFEAGKTHMERCVLGGNRSGKTETIGCYETSVHATGQYPTWWVGRKFERPVNIWVVGKTSETTRDILQTCLCGPVGQHGTGMLPGDTIIHTTSKAGVANAADTIWVRHTSGGVSTIGLKSYGRDRDSFEGTKRDMVYLDEECPKDIYDECLMRLMSTKPGVPSGLMLITFTPLEGYTEVVKNFLESDDPGRWFTQITWADCPHLTKEITEEMSRKYLPSQLRARSMGEPSIGEGAVYPIEIEELMEDDFPIPAHWPRAFGMDVGKTAVVWGALDRDSDVLHLYREYYSEQYSPLMHAAAIKGIDNRDAWIPGVIDPGALGSSQVDGQKLMDIYTREYGLHLTRAVNAVEAGIHAVWQRMITGRLKVFRSMTRWRNEFTRYHRVKRETLFGESAKIVKKSDHLMDSCRYLCVSGIDLMVTEPHKPTLDELLAVPVAYPNFGGAWMA